MKDITIIILLTILGVITMSQTVLTTGEKNQKEKEYPKALSDYNDFKDLVLELEAYRKERLVSLDTFLKMSQEENTVILDTRSIFHYNRKHLKGAIHLSFTGFTKQELWRLIPDRNTRILIYCNNNFEGDPISFASKIATPGEKVTEENKNREIQNFEIMYNRKPIMLALNIPTFVNLYGYGYKNVYELDELVNITDPRIEFEGTLIGK